MPLYDHIGETYAGTRRADPRIAARILAALGDSTSVLNVGAGTGSYEPTDRRVVAVEPAATMLRQRPGGAAPAVRAVAERLPFPDRSFDAVLAVNTVQHWPDVRAGLRELRRVARRRVVVLLRDARRGYPFWLTERYLPALDATARLTALATAVEEELSPDECVPVPLPRDCADGVFTAWWARPEMYLDPRVRANISNFALAGEATLAAGLAALQDDTSSGEWDRRCGHLRSLPELDLGHRLFITRTG